VPNKFLAPMSEPVRQPERVSWSNRLIIVVLVCIVAYFGLGLVPNWYPGFGSTELFFLYILSIPVVLLVLLGLGTWATVGLFLSWRRRVPASGRHRTLLLVACIGFVCFLTSMTLARVIRGALPTGSHLLRFDSALWKDPNSLRFIAGDVTPRQKMLGDVVQNVLPGRTRAELEELLGPSLDTPYFRTTGRDLIYVLGSERDSLFAIDSEWLLIWLDSSGRFERYAIYTD